MNETYLKDLLYWVKERDRMRLRKEVDGAPPPWTDDPIMANNRWCNVHREDDKVTRWIFKNWLCKPDQHLQIAACIGRVVNWPETLVLLGYPKDGWSPAYRSNWLKTFEDLRRAGKKAWTGAYMVTGGYSAGGEPKEVIIARVLDGAAERPHIQIHDTLAVAAEKLATPGIGTFLAAQVIADLKHTPLLEAADDWWEWCAPGPGSTMGLNFLHDRPRAKPLPPSQFMDEVNQVRTFILKELGVGLCAHNTQNCLCELSKYIRAKYFGERLKNSYRAQ